MELLWLGPICIRTLLRTKEFNSVSAASHKMTQMTKRNRVKYSNEILLDEIRDGRSEMFRWNRFIKPDMQRHEAYLMEVITSYWPCQAKTGYDTDPNLRSDGTMNFGGQTYQLELDKETMTRDQIQARWKKYLGCQDTLLVVTLSDSRAQRLVKWSQELGKLAYVSTVQKVIAEPFGKHWTAMDGSLVAIKQPQDVH